MKHFYLTILLVFCLTTLISFTSAEVVCSEDELVREIVEDIKYNGIIIIFNIK